MAANWRLLEDELVDAFQRLGFQVSRENGIAWIVRDGPRSTTYVLNVESLARALTDRVTVNVHPLVTAP